MKHSTQIVQEMIAHILSKMQKQITERFHLQVSYQFASEVSMMKLKHITSAELLRQKEISMLVEEEPKAIKADSSMTPNIIHPIHPQPCEQTMTHSSFHKSGALKRSKTLTETKFKRQLSKMVVNQQLQKLPFENPEQGFITGLRQLKQQQIKYRSTKQPKPKKSKLEKNSDYVFDYNGDTMKLMPAESTHIIRSIVSSRLLATKTIVPISETHIKTARNIGTSLKQTKQPRPQKVSEYSAGLPLKHLELEKGVKLLLNDGSVMENARKQSSTKLIRDLSMKEYTRLKILKSIEKQKGGSVWNKSTNESCQINEFREARKTTIETNSTSVITFNKLPVLPEIRSSRHQSLIRTRKEGRLFKQLMEEKNKRFENILRSVV